MSEVSSVANDLVDHRLDGLERKFEVLKYPIVRTGEVLEPVGVLADFSADITDAVVAERALRDFLPIPHRNNREGYCGDDHARYWLTGLEDYDKVVAAVPERRRQGSRLYDFGGSTGRVFRHFFCQERSFEVWTSDFKVANFAWNQRYIPSEVRIFLNGFYPSLPIPDEHSTSSRRSPCSPTSTSSSRRGCRVATDSETRWIALRHDSRRRVLGGHVGIRAHGDPEQPERVHVTSASPFPDERTAFHFTEEGYYSCNVFHPTNTSIASGGASSTSSMSGHGTTKVSAWSS